MDAKFEDVRRCLRPEAARAIENATPELLCEIRLRAGRPLYITCGAENIALAYICRETDVAYAVDMLCGGSRHTYGEMIRRGYIPGANGVRAGICGEAVNGERGVEGMRRITSVNLRIPHAVTGAADDLIKLLAADAFSLGALIYSPPMEGKTTLLRDAAARLSSPPYKKRCCVVDTRGEIYIKELFDGTDAAPDFLTGYPKGEGIECACRSMSPQLIFTDELGGGDCPAVLAAQNCGVPLIATAHAASFASLMLRPPFKMLYEHNVFGHYLRLERSGDKISLTEENIV
ncbi:MAG: hypothetical protein WCQ72_01555 [Eubacteriales bacterium]